MLNQITFNLIVGTLLRSAVMLLAGWLAAKGLLPTGTIEEWGAAVTLAVLTVLWSLYSRLTAKHEAAVLLQTALKLPAGATEDEVRALVKSGREV